ncbi:M48 family metallopeptidase [Paraliomyxa miuraensis]|uniref:M48 family metallopeptidase n=1 Tax=Paraliomyxa miuraensis TaxID=376150 RepID=UPI00225727DB|nr:M48 family metallopeptidase [Paraliomyxa miuraensis]MCX4239279.1 M48 family metallopeptidase [Paraliomyxa miuraensis]
MLAILLLVAFISFPLFSGLVAPLVPQQVVDAVGAEMIKDTASQGSFCVAPEGKAALQKMAGRIAPHIGDYELKIYVSDQEVFNAFAAPGGHIVIYQQIIAHSDGPNEVAGVLAHEVGHVIEDHPTKGLVEAVGYGIFSAMTPGSDDTKRVAKSLLTSAYSRNDELEADRRGVELLNAAGIDSRGLFSFFDRIKQAGDQIPGALQFLSTHPSGETRRENLEDVALEGEPSLTDEEWKALENICSEKGLPQPVIVRGTVD